MKKRLWVSLLAIVGVLMVTGCSIVISNGHRSPGKTITRTLSKKQFKNLSVDVELANVKFKKGKDFKITYHGAKNLMPKFEQSGNSVKLTQKISGIIVNNEVQNIEVTIPASKLGKIDIKGEDSNVSLDYLTAANLAISLEDGDISIDQLKADYVDFESEDGNMNINSLLTKYGAKLRSEDGNIDIKTHNATGYKLSTEDGFIRVANKDIHHASYQQNVHTNNVLDIELEDGNLNLQ